jgi:Na+-driven multidrug efflux pump
MMFFLRKCCGARTQRQTRVTVIASAVSLLIGGLASTLGTHANSDHDEHKAFWIYVTIGIAAASIVALLIVFLVKWRQGEERR